MTRADAVRALIDACDAGARVRCPLCGASVTCAVLDTRVKHDPVYSFDRITGRVLRGASVETTAIHCGVEIRTTFVVGDAP